MTEDVRKLFIQVKAPPQQVGSIMEFLTRMAGFCEDMKKKGLILDYDLGIEANFTWILKTGAEIIRKVEEAEKEEALRKGEEPKPEAAAPVPEFDPQELMTHDWKGKKKTEGEGYEPWDQNWGWDGEDQFSQIVLQVLEKGPLKIGQYEFAWNRERKLVNVRKVKKG